MPTPRNAPILAATALLAASTDAQQIPIVNPGFESISRPLASGEQTNGIAGEGTPVGTRSPYPFGTGVVNWDNPVTVPGWRTRTVPFGDPGEILAGVLRPGTIDGDPFITGIEGVNALSIQAALVGQKTDSLLMPNTTYTLSFLAGISRFDSEYFPSVTLTAIDQTATLPIDGQPGVTRLALSNLSTPTSDPDGLMHRYELEYTTPEQIPASLADAHLGISVFGSDGLPRVIYDDFRLSASAVPAPGPPACLLLGGALAATRRRRAR